MKLMILGLIFGSISCLGYLFGTKYKEKVKFYTEFYNLIVYIKNQIGFFKTDIIQILESFSTKNKNILLLIENYKNYLLTGQIQNLNILTKQENEEIYTFLKGVGANDCFTQNDFLEKYISNFKEKLNEAKNLYLKYGVLYKKLGVLLAIFVCIVIA